MRITIEPTNFNSNSNMRKNSSMMTNKEKKFDIPTDKNRKIKFK